MKKIIFVLLVISIMIFSNLLAVSSFNNQQKNQVAQDFYSSGASFMRVGEFLKAKDFFIYSHNEAIKAGNNYLAYTANERIKDCNNILGLNENDYTLSTKLMSKDISLPSSTGSTLEYRRSVTLNVYSYKKHDYISFTVSKGQNLSFKYLVTKGDVSIYFMDKNSFNKFKNSSYFTYDLSIGGIQLPSKVGVDYTQTYTVPESGEWYLLLVTNSSEAGELQMDIL
ncbi:MAG: hypothetical protein AMQ74_01209 [Candidatus Methanofastidiosum methylothiophilum]|uniref:Uncharacterized protein n=1 Tax=Candidatus Methanofastidiosum methylothiophilum TaxID=1705564 RepID=A0A150J0P6_9EURY|nr:MAG: hypothetical protein AMQ74_01209 [Candidatus Methanofastidiosum methylthiophilus]NMC76859.1 hypothetical protein [Candidatus Methanofastidiosa archaeon]